MIEFSNLTWKEIESVFKKKKIVIIPIGSTEQHGFHLPLSTDSIISYEIAKKVCEDLGILLAPLLPISCSAEHRDFPGTIYLTPDSFEVYLEDICKSLSSRGFEKTIILNGHGGNENILRKILPKIERRVGAKIYSINTFDLIEKNKTQVHAEELETSLILYLKPDLVKKKEIVDEYPEILKKQLGKLEKSKVSWRMHTKSGVVGYPTRASKEKGKKFFQKMVNNFKEFITSI